MVQMFLFALLACFALPVFSSSNVVRLNVPGAAGVPSWFSTLTYVYNDASESSITIFLSGTIGTPFPSNPGPPHLVPGGIGNQTTQSLDNIIGALPFACKDAFPQIVTECDKTDWKEQLTKCRVYLAMLEGNEQSAFDAAWVSFFNSSGTPNPPARMAFQGAILVAGARVEIECDAFFAPFSFKK